MKSSVFLPISPNPSQRSRCTCRGRFATIYTDPKYRDWKDEAIRLLSEIEAPFPKDTPSEADVIVGLEVVVEKPKTTKRRRPKGDRDNYEKGVFDAITQAGGWWVDDDQIVGGPFLKRWAKPDETPGYHITVEFLQ